MWVEIVCGLVIYKLFRRFFSGDDDLLDFDSSASNALFSVASRLEKLYGGKAYVGLRIPDPDTGSRQYIDLALVAKGEVVVVSVKNFAGVISIRPDGSWVCIDESHYKEHSHPDPAAEAKKAASVLESYLEQRGVALPDGYLSYKVILPNPKFGFRTLVPLDYFPPEVITYEQWAQLKPESKSMLSGWIKGAFRGAKKEMQETMHQQLNFVLGTAPMWDSDELLLEEVEEESSDKNCLATEFGKVMHLSSAESLVGVRRSTNAPTSITSSFIRQHGPAQSFTHVEPGKPPSHDQYFGQIRGLSNPSHFVPQPSHNSLSRLGQQPAQRLYYGRATSGRGNEWNYNKMQAPASSFNNGGPHPHGNSSFINGMSWGRRASDAFTSIPPTSRGRKDYGRIA